MLQLRNQHRGVPNRVGNTAPHDILQGGSRNHTLLTPLGESRNLAGSNATVVAVRVIPASAHHPSTARRARGEPSKHIMTLCTSRILRLVNPDARVCLLYLLWAENRRGEPLDPDNLVVRTAGVDYLAALDLAMAVLAIARHAKGLSPRGRGNQERILLRISRNGSIPAWAGQPQD